METKDVIALFSLLVAIVSVIIAVIAIVRTGFHAKSQRDLQQKLSDDEKVTANRRFFTVLWDKMTELNYINPQSPIGPDVRKAVNTLEAVAMCWQAGIIDKQMVVISFGKLFEELYNQINQIALVPGINKSGHELLTQNRAVPLVHKEIQDELNKQGRIS